MEPSGIETGTVLKTEGLWATVVTDKSKSCRECGKAQAGICGKQGAGMVMQAKNPLGAHAGDTVSLELEKSTHRKAYFFAFILPVASLFLGTIAGDVLSRMNGVNGLDLILGFIGLIAAAILSYRKIQQLDRTSHMEITRIYDKTPLHSSPAYGSSEGLEYLSAFEKSR